MISNSICMGNPDLGLPGPNLPDEEGSPFLGRKHEQVMVEEVVEDHATSVTFNPKLLIISSSLGLTLSRSIRVSM